MKLQEKVEFVMKQAQLSKDGVGEHTTHRICKEMNIPGGNMLRYTNGKPVDRMALITADKLGAYYDEHFAMLHMEETLAYIREMTDGKYDESDFFITGYRNFESLLEEFDIDFDELKERTNMKNFDFMALHRPFILKDFHGEEFVFLTEFTEEAVQYFIDDLLSK